MSEYGNLSGEASDAGDPKYNALSLKNEVFGIAIFSFVVMVQASHVCRIYDNCNEPNDGNTIYIIIASLLSFLTSTAIVFTGKGGMLPVAVRAGFAIFWLIAACVCTFDPPFNFLGNGYFAAWTCTILSFQWLSSDASVQEKLGEMTSSSRKEKAIVLLAAASMVELVAACVACDNLPSSQKCTEYYGFAVAMGVISLVISIAWVALFNKITGNAAKALSAVMCVLWLVGAFAFTIKEPFRAAGNGYFASWIACLSCLYLFWEICLNEKSQAPTSIEV